jgi:hypothetical protein
LLNAEVINNGALQRGAGPDANTTDRVSFTTVSLPRLYGVRTNYYF